MQKRLIVFINTYVIYSYCICRAVCIVRIKQHNVRYRPSASRAESVSKKDPYFYYFFFYILLLVGHPVAYMTLIFKVRLDKKKTWRKIIIYLVCLLHLGPNPMEIRIFIPSRLVRADSSRRALSASRGSRRYFCVFRRLFFFLGRFEISSVSQCGLGPPGRHASPAVLPQNDYSRTANY